MSILKKQNNTQVAENSDVNFSQSRRLQLTFFQTFSVECFDQAMYTGMGIGSLIVYVTTAKGRFSSSVTWVVFSDLSALSPSSILANIQETMMQP